MAKAKSQAEADALPPFAYTPITPDDFRVLKITAVSPHLRFTLQTFSIHDAPEYEALSYAWGSGAADEAAVCNGARFLISQNLGQALRAAHRQAPSAWLWADAICINQADNAEKAHQVEGMAELYSYAHRVLIWLGEAADDSDLVCDLLPALNEHIWALRDEDGVWRRSLNEKEMVAHRLPPPEDSLWRAVLMLYARPWFQRLWIVQEIVLARRCVFLCGRRKVEWDVMVNFAQATLKSIVVSEVAGLHVVAMGEEAVNRSSNGILLMVRSWKLQEGMAKPDMEVNGLSIAMAVMQSQSAAVKVDYVYAILGLLGEGLGINVVVDYSDEAIRNYGKVHADFFRLCVERLNDWPSIYFPAKRPSGGVPSWCPSWGSGFNESYMVVARSRAGRPTPKSHFRDFYCPSPDDAEVEDGILRVAGITVDVIQNIIPLHSTFEDVDLNDFEMSRVINMVKKCAAYMPDGLDNQQRFLGTLIGEWDWLASTGFSDAPDGPLLDSFFEFLEPIAANEARRGEPDYAPVDINTVEYILEKHHFWRKYFNLLRIRWPHMSFGMTKHGRIALLPCEASIGDTLCVFLGATLPQILAPHEDGKHWRYVGPSVVDGLVKGETFETMDDWESKKETFCLK